MPKRKVPLQNVTRQNVDQWRSQFNDDHRSLPLVCFREDSEVAVNGLNLKAGQPFIIRRWDDDNEMYYLIDKEHKDLNDKKYLDKFVAPNDIRSAHETYPNDRDRNNVVTYDSWLGNTGKKKSNEGISLKSIVLADETREQIDAAIAQIDNAEMIFEEWGFSEVIEKGKAVSLLFHGPPGTGKTLSAQAIADEIGLTLNVVDSGTLRSQVPGQFERTVKVLFEEATKQGQLLFFDECDSVIMPRQDVGAIMAAECNSILTAIEKYEGVVIFCTNRLGRMDEALERRISAKVHFPMPNKEQREAIWRRLIPKKAPIPKNIDFSALADIPISGGKIKNAVLSAARYAAYKKYKKINQKCFLYGVQKELSALEDFNHARTTERSPHTALSASQDMAMSQQPSISTSSS